MKITLIAVGQRMPEWVTQGYQEYANRFPKQFSLQLVEIALTKRSKKSDLNRCQAIEGDLMLKAIPQGDRVVALEVGGRQLTTPQLSQTLQEFHDQALNISLLVGGPEGLAPACVKRADQSWSLSALTLPHPLVRVLLAEQLYRAWTLMIGHPYHRE